MDDEELDEELDPDLEVDPEEDLDDEIVDDEIDEDLEPIDDVDPDEDGEVAAVVKDEDEADDEVPTARQRPRSGDEEEDEDDLNPDDVEADLDTILKDRIAAGDADEEEEEVEEVTGDPGDRVAAKTADEFTCPTCFLIVHPRQFGRLGRLTCPEGYDPCGSMTKVEAALKKARKG